MTLVQITITLPVEGEDTATNPEVVAALDSLADVMLVQAEDGLWTLGSPESEDENGPSQYLRGIGSGMTYSVKIYDPSVSANDLASVRPVAEGLAQRWASEAERLAFDGEEYDNVDDEMNELMSGVYRECSDALLGLIPLI